MIWIDFSIICIDQAKPSIPPNIKSDDIDIYERTADSGSFYPLDYNFRTADALTGYWYMIWLPEEIKYDESFFDISERNCPWINVIPKWKDTVINVLEFYLNESPKHRIAVLLRVQDDSNDVVHPVCKLDEFINDLTEGNIRYNELYFIEN